ncbi:DUF4044 domain-containing protein [Paenibacillus sediminis]|uniref:DUF4044 domain-containing protein n=1 Tax=Paenibacillus sediminis TaxID=664909 RepID=A0ABS4H3M4_9BACL|nr:hypothetical protein [Paenibacillus sediminis]
MQSHKKQERTLIIVCVVVAIVMLYAFIRSFIRYSHYFS